MSRTIQESVLFGMDLEKRAGELGISEDELWGKREHTLWQAELYPECDGIQAAVKASLNLYEIFRLWR